MSVGTNRVVDLHKLLSDLVAASEAGKKFEQLHKELVSQMAPGETKAYRMGEYNIVVAPAYGSHSVRIDRITPVETPKHGEAQNEVGCYTQYPGTNKGAVKEAYENLLGAFSWFHAPEGWSYWNDVANKLRFRLGRPPIRD